MSDVLEYFRTEIDPRFRDVPDAELAEYIDATYPQFKSDPEFRRLRVQQVGQSRLAADTAEEAVPEGIVAPGFEALGQGMAQMAGSIGQYSKAISQLLPFGTPAEASGLGSYLRTFSDVSPELTPQSSLKDVARAYNERGLAAGAREAGAGLAGLTLQQVPQMVASIIGGGAGTAAGLTPRAAAILSTTLNTLPQEAGGAYEEIGQRTGEQGPGAAIAALGVGAINTGLEAFGDIPILTRALGGDSRLPAQTIRAIAARFGIDVARSVAGESATEAMQEVAPSLAPPLFGAPLTENLPERMAEAAYAGAAGGIGLGGAAAVSTSARSLRALRNPPIVPQRTSPPVAPLPAAPLFTPRSDQLNYLPPSPPDPGVTLAAVQQAEAVVAQEVNDQALQAEQSQIAAQGQARLQEIDQVPVPPTPDPVMQALQAIEKAKAKTEALAQAVAARKSAAQRRAAVASGLELPQNNPPPEPAPVGQYPPEGFGTGTIPSPEEMARRAQVRAEAEARGRARQGLATVPEAPAPAPVAPAVVAPPAAVPEAVPVVVAPAPKRGINPGLKAYQDKRRAEKAVAQQPSPIPDAIQAQPAEVLQEVGQEATVPVQEEVQAQAAQPDAVAPAPPLPPNPMRTGRGRNAPQRDPLKVGLDMTTAAGRREYNTRKKAAEAPAQAMPPRKPLAVIRAENPDVDPQEANNIRWVESKAVRSLDNLTPEEQKRVDYDNGILPKGTAEPPQTNKTRWSSYMSRMLPYMDQALAGSGLSSPLQARVYDAVMRDGAKRWNEAEAAGGKFMGFVKREKRGMESYRWVVDNDTTRAMNREISTIRNAVENQAVESPASTEDTTQEGEIIESLEVQQKALKDQEQEEARQKRIEKKVDGVQAVAERIAGRPLTIPERKSLIWELGELVQKEDNDLPPPDENIPAMKALAPKVLAEMRAAQVRQSLNEVEIEPITAEEVRAAISDATGGKVPLNVEVIDDPNHTLPNGEAGTNTAGYVAVQPDGSFRIILNAAFIGSRNHAVQVLAEEAVHVVWSDPEIQDAWNLFKESVSPNELAAKRRLGYKDEALLEEAAVAKVIAHLQGRGSRSLAPATFVARLWAKVKEFLGLSNDWEKSRDRILLRAIKALHEGGVATPGGGIRKSIVQGRFTSRKDVETSTQNAGDPGTIAVAAQLTGAMIPEASKATIAALQEGTPTQKRAASYLTAVSNVAELDDAFIATISAPIDGVLVSDPDVPEEAGDTAARSILRTDLGFQHLSDRLSARLEVAQKSLNEAMDRLTQAEESQADALSAKHQAEDLIQVVDRMITLELRTAGPSLPAQEKLEASEASRKLSAAKKANATAIGVGLQSIASQIPDIVLDADRAIGSDKATRDWIVERQTDTSKTQVFSPEVWEFLTTPLPGRRKSPLDLFRGLSSTMDSLRQLQLDRVDALKELGLLRKEFSATANDKKVSTRQALQRYANLWVQYKKGAALAQSINRKVDRELKKTQSLKIAIDVLDGMIATPSYRASVVSAMGRLNAFGTSVYHIPETRAGYDGIVQYKNPFSGGVVELNFTPSVEQRADFEDKARSLISDVERYLALPNKDPYIASQWERVLPRLKASMDLTAPGSVVKLVPEKIPFLGGRQIYSGWSLVRRLTFKKLTSANNLAAKIGGPVAQLVVKLHAAHDTIFAKLEDARDSKDPAAPTQGRITRTTIAGMKSHNWKPGNVTLQSRWDRHINWIISQNQNPGSRPYKVGEHTPWGDEITVEDMEGAWAQKRWQHRAFMTFQRGTKGTISEPIWELPLQTTEIVPPVTGRGISRAAVDYGMKMSRPVPTEGANLVRQWIEGSPSVRQAMLVDHFTELVLAMAIESNPEFAMSFDPLDQKIFRELEVMSKAGDLPFDGYEEFLGWVAQNRFEDREEETDEASELDEARQRVEAYVSRYMAGMNRAHSISSKGVPTDRPQRLVGASSGTIVSPDNEFLRPRGALHGPSSLYSYSVTDNGRQETFKANGLTALMLRELDQWNALRETLRRRVADFKARIERLKEGGLSEGQAQRRVAIQSRAEHLSGADIADYATLRDQLGFVDGFISQLERGSTERIGPTGDVAPVLFGRRILSGISSLLLSPFTPTVRNLIGAVWIHGHLLGALSRANQYLFMSRFLGKVVHYLAGQSIGALADRVPSFKSWVTTEGRGLGGMLSEAMVFAHQAEQGGRNALAIDVPNWRERVALIKELRSSAGTITPGQETPLLISIWNQIGAFSYIPHIAQIISNFAPGAVDRMANAISSSMDRDLINDPKLLASYFDVWKAREERDPGGYADLTRVGSRFQVGEFAGREGSKSLQLKRDLTTPIGSWEGITLNWYERTKGMTPQDRYSTPLFENEGQEDSFVREILKMTNLPAPSTSQEALKGKGLGGLGRAAAGQFLRYGINLSEVGERLNEQVAGKRGQKELTEDARLSMWHGIAGATALLILAILSKETTDLWKRFVEQEPVSTPSIVQIAGTGDPLELARYAAGAASFLLPYGGDQLSQVLGGTSNRRILDLTQMVPSLGIAADIANTGVQIAQTRSLFWPITDLAKRIVPLSKIPINALVPGDVIRRESMRAVRGAAQPGLELRPQVSGPQARATPMSPLVRDAVNAALVGDRGAFDAAFKRAVKYQTGLGKTPEDAAKAVENAISAREPIRSVVGRNLTPEEEKTLMGRMTPWGRQSYQRAVGVLRTTPRKARNPMRRGSRKRNAMRGGRSSRRKRSVMRGRASSVRERL